MQPCGGPVSRKTQADHACAGEGDLSVRNSEALVMRDENSDSIGRRKEYGLVTRTAEPLVDGTVNVVAGTSQAGEGLVAP